MHAAFVETSASNNSFFAESGRGVIGYVRELSLADRRRDDPAGGFWRPGRPLGCDGEQHPRWPLAGADRQPGVQLGASKGQAAAAAYLLLDGDHFLALRKVGNSRFALVATIDERS